MDIQKIKAAIRNVPDFPIPGIQFKDLTTVFKDAELLRELGDGLYDQFKGMGITKVVGIESRGFIMGPILATKLDAGFVTLRKPGKLPAETYCETYDKEYGTDTIEIHRDAIGEDDIVLIHDDLLATGGTMVAAQKLVERFNPKKVIISCIVELEFLEGRKLFDPATPVETLIKF
ncbi:MAG: adenine phosphoribosyltransferase [Bacteroidales bacterium]